MRVHLVSQGAPRTRSTFEPMLERLARAGIRAVDDPGQAAADLDGDGVTDLLLVGGAGPVRLDPVPLTPP